MPISTPKRPVVLLVGQVIGRTPKQKYADGRATGEVERYDVTIMQAGMGMPDVRFPLAADAPRVPEDGEKVALLAEIGETREYGANLRALRYVTDSDLENVVGYLPTAPASK